MSLILALATPWLTHPCLAASLNDLAKQHYKEGRIETALHCCRKIIRSNPDEPGAHYLLANCHYLRGNKAAALEQYRIAFELDPFGEAGRYARQALLGMNASLADPDDANPELPPTDRSESIKQAVAKIRDQIQVSRTSSQNLGKRYAEQSQRSGETRIKQLRQAAEDTAGDILPRNRRPSAAQQAEAAYWQSFYYAEQQRARNDAYIQAQKHRAWAAKRERSLEECGESLCLLLAEQPQAGKHKLLASGTSVYVRNYGAGELEALRAQSLAAYDSGSGNKSGSKNFSLYKKPGCLEQQISALPLAKAGRINRTVTPASFPPYELNYLDKRVSKVSGKIIKPIHPYPGRPAT